MVVMGCSRVMWLVVRSCDDRCGCSMRLVVRSCDVMRCGCVCDVVNWEMICCELRRAHVTATRLRRPFQCTVQPWDGTQTSESPCTTPPHYKALLHIKVLIHTTKCYSVLYSTTPYYEVLHNTRN